MAYKNLTIEEKAMQKMNSVALSKYGQYADRQLKLKTLLAKLQETLMGIDDLGLTRVGVSDLKGTITSYGVVIDNVMLCEKCQRLFHADHDDVPRCDDDIHIVTNRIRRKSRVYPYLSQSERERLEAEREEE